MHYIFKASMHVSGDKVEWYWDSKNQASQFINQTMEECKKAHKYFSSPCIQPVLVAAGETAFDYNYPYIPRITNMALRKEKECEN